MQVCHQLFVHSHSVYLSGPERLATENLHILTVRLWAHRRREVFSLEQCLQGKDVPNPCPGCSAPSPCRSPGSESQLSARQWGHACDVKSARGFFTMQVCMSFLISPVAAGKRGGQACISRSHPQPVHLPGDGGEKGILSSSLQQVHPLPPCGRCQTRADEAVSVTCCVFNCTVCLSLVCLCRCVSAVAGAVCVCARVCTCSALSGFIRARLSLARWPFGFVSSGLCHSLLVPQHKCIFHSFLTDRLPGHLSMSLWLLSSC